MEPQAPPDSPDAATASGDAVPDQPRILASAVTARPQPSQSTLLMVGAAGTFVSMAMVLAFVWLRGETAPVHTAAATTPPAVDATASPVITESAPAPTWTGQPKATLAFDGSKTITFELQAARDVPIWMSQARPMLTVRCVSRETQAFVILGTSAAYEADALHRTIHLQWDDGQGVGQRWLTSESGQELFAPDAVAFVRELAKAKRLRFEFTPFNARPVTTEFAVEGFDKLAGLVASTCGYHG